MKHSKILITGGTGMIGSAFKEALPDAIFVSSKDCDLTKEEGVNKLFAYHKPEAIIHLAARVGGVKANYSRMADFFYENIKINTNVLHYAWKNDVDKVVSLLSTCVYPDMVCYPLTENQIHNGPPHYTNFGYAYAKRMLQVQSDAYKRQYGCNFITAVPNNLFGEHDNFHLEDSHVIPAIIRKIYEAKIKEKKSVSFWGHGLNLREFTYSGDIAKALLYLLENYDSVIPMNIGNTKQLSIKAVVEKVSNIFSYDGRIRWDSKKLNGQFQKPSSNDRFLKLGWKKSNYTSFDESLQKTCDWFMNNYPNVRGV